MPGEATAGDLGTVRRVRLRAATWDFCTDIHDTIWGWLGYLSMCFFRRPQEKNSCPSRITRKGLKKDLCWELIPNQGPTWRWSRQERMLVWLDRVLWRALEGWDVNTWGVAEYSWSNTEKTFWWKWKRIFCLPTHEVIFYSWDVCSPSHEHFLIYLAFLDLMMDAFTPEDARYWTKPFNASSKWNWMVAEMSYKLKVLNESIHIRTC